jgi:hypothetical protein
VLGDQEVAAVDLLAGRSLAGVLAPPGPDGAESLPVTVLGAVVRAPAVVASSGERGSRPGFVAADANEPS